MIIWPTALWALLSHAGQKSLTAKTSPSSKNATPTHNMNIIKKAWIKPVLYHLCLWLSKVLFVQVAVIHLLQNQHFRLTGRQYAAHRCPQGGKTQPQAVLVPQLHISLFVCFQMTHLVFSSSWPRGSCFNVFADPGQLCRVGSQPVCIRTSCANPCKTDHGQDCHQCILQKSQIDHNSIQMGSFVCCFDFML